MANIDVTVGLDTREYSAGWQKVSRDAASTAGLISRSFHSMTGVFGNVFGSLARSTNLILSHLLSIRTALAGFASGFLIVRFVQGFINAGQELENFRVQLTAVYRGAGLLAERALQGVIEFARVTPFTTQEAVQAFTMLKSVGIDVTNSILEAIGNTAFVFNRKMTDVSMAMISMETETLRRLGIILDRTGEKAVIMSGGITKEVKNTRDAIFVGLISLMKDLFPGAMKNAENTFRGAMANLKSLFEEFSYATGSRITSFLVPKIKEFISKFEELQKSGVMKALEIDLARVINRFLELGTQGITYVVEQLQNVDFNEVANQIEELTKKAVSFGIEAASALSKVWDISKGMLSWLNSLDPAVKAAGIIGLLLFGPKGALVLAATVAGVKAAVEGMGIVGPSGPKNRETVQGLIQEREAAGKSAWLERQVDKLYGLFGIGRGAVGPAAAAPSRTVPPGAEQQRIEAAIAKASGMHGIDPNLIKAIIQIESGFRPGAQGPEVPGLGKAGGLMQLMPGTAKRYGVTDVFDIEQNIMGGVAALADFMKQFQGQIELALAAYGGFKTKDPTEYLGKIMAEQQRFAGGAPGAEGRTWAQLFGMGTAQAAGGGIAEITKAEKKPLMIRTRQLTDVEEQLEKIGYVYEYSFQETQKAIREQEDLEKKYRLNASNLIEKQEEAIKDNIETMMIEAQAASLVGTKQEELKTVLTGGLSIRKAIREAQLKEKELGPELEATIAKVTERYRDLAAAQAGAAQTKGIEDLLRSRREEVEDLQLEVRHLRDVTTEEKAIFQVAKDMLSIRRQFPGLTEDQLDALERVLLVWAKIRTGLERTRDAAAELAQTIQQALEQAVQNIQTAFSDLWYNVFTGGVNSFRDFLGQLADSMLRTVSNIMGVLATAIIDELVYAITGSTIKQAIESLAKNIANSIKGIFTGGGSGGGALGSLFGGLGGWFGGLFGGGGAGAGAGLFDHVGGLVVPGGVMRFQHGGVVPSLLEPGEFIMRTSAVRSLGTSNLAHMNETGMLPDNRHVPVDLRSMGPAMGSVDDRPIRITLELHRMIDPAALKSTPAEMVKAFSDDMLAGGKSRHVVIDEIRRSG